MRKILFIIAGLFLTLGFSAEMRGQAMLYPVKVNGKYGYIDSTGKVVIQPKYDEASSFVNGYATIKQPHKGFWSFILSDDVGIIDLNGNVKILKGFDEIGPFYNGLAYAKKSGFFMFFDEYGYIDTAMDIKINPVFSSAGNFTSGLARVKTKKYQFLSTPIVKYGFINSKGAIVVPIALENAGEFYDNRANFTIDDAEGLKDTLRNITIINPDPKRDGMHSRGFIDDKGNIAIAPKYDRVGHFSMGLAPVLEGTKWGYIDKQGNTKLPFVYDDARPFSNGLALAMKDGKWNYIDTTGNIAFPTKYTEVGAFSNDLAAAKINDKWGYIDKEGNIAIQPKFDQAYSFSGDLAAVRMDDMFGYINKKGDYVWEPSK